MIRGIPPFLGVVFFLVFGPAGISSAAPGWEQIGEGFEAKSLQVEGEPYQSLIKLNILRIGLDRFEVKVLDSRGFGTIRMEIRDLARKAEALAAINGGFFLPDLKPLGLLIVDGKETNPLRNADWGIFLIQDEAPRIIHTREYVRELHNSNHQNISQALQVGPRLVVTGRELQMKKQSARRSAIGINLKNQVILVNTADTEAFAQDLARIFYLPESQGGLECRDAITLDGGPSAQMYVEYKSLKIDIRGSWGVPNGLGVFKRRGAGFEKR